MSLKHKNTSKWAKKQAIYAKYSDKAREQVQEQIQLSKELTKKVKEFEYDDEDDDKHEATSAEAHNDAQLLKIKSTNPWTRMMGEVGLIKESCNEEQNPAVSEPSEYSRPKSFRDVSVLESNNSKDIDEKLTKELQLETSIIFNEKSNEIIQSQPNEDKYIPEEMPLSSVQGNLADISPIFSSKIKKETQLPSINRANDSNHQLTLSEAFADDDVVEEFRAEKVTINFFGYYLITNSYSIKFKIKLIFIFLIRKE
jgi:U3 small nucleolar RNA-associated protein 14